VGVGESGVSGRALSNTYVTTAIYTAVCFVNSVPHRKLFQIKAVRLNYMRIYLNYMRVYLSYMRVYLNYMRVLSHAPISSAMSKQYDGWL
jgi:hypothetical protein